MSLAVYALNLLKRFKLLMMPVSRRREMETCHWETTDLARTRSVSWDAINCFGLMAVSEMTGGRWEQFMDVIIDSIAPPDPSHLRGLTLGCGDMACEHWFFIHPALPFALVDAYDISGGMIQLAKERTDRVGLNVQYHIEDANDIELPLETYDLVVVAHSLHHFERIDHVMNQVDRALKPGGVLAVWEYVGPRYLQFSRRQLAWANRVLRILPLKYQRGPDGRICKRIGRPPLYTISPDEAVRSERILPALERMRVLYQYNWAGLLYPLLQGGLAANFDENDPEDRKVIDLLFQLDRLLCQSGQVEPNFTIAAVAKTH